MKQQKRDFGGRGSLLPVCRKAVPAYVHTDGFVCDLRQHSIPTAIIAVVFSFQTTHTFAATEPFTFPRDAV